MKRAEALEKFQTAHQAQAEVLRQEFTDSLPGQAEKLTAVLLAAFGEIREQADRQGRESLVHFHFSLLACGFWDNQAQARLDAMGLEEYLEEDPLTVGFDLTFLYLRHFAWKEKLMEDMREYRGKVNRYDVENMVRDEIMACHMLTAAFLRIAFRSLEGQEAFAKIPKLPFYKIRWGEYRDYSEVLLYVNREERTQREWEERLETEEADGDGLAVSYWYRGKFTAGDCRMRKLYFTTFEACSLSGIDFTGADLTGTRFLNCTIDGCNFAGATLRLAEFAGCRIEGTDFTGAAMGQAVFDEEGFDLSPFDGEQLSELFLARYGKEEGVQG